MFDAAYPTHYHKLGSEGLYQWGPDLPPNFGLPRMNLSKALRLVRQLIKGEGLSLGKLMEIKKTMAAPARPWLG